MTAPKPPSPVCRNGHPYTRENTRMKRGARKCLTCQRAQVIRYRSRQREAA